MGSKFSCVDPDELFINRFVNFLLQIKCAKDLENIEFNTKFDLIIEILDDFYCNFSLETVKIISKICGFNLNFILLDNFRNCDNCVVLTISPNYNKFTMDLVSVKHCITFSNRNHILACLLSASNIKKYFKKYYDIGKDEYFGCN